MPDRHDAQLWADTLEADLRTVSTEARAEHERAYLKSDLDFLGVRTPDLRKMVRRHLAQTEGLDHGALIAVVEALWDSTIYERRAAAVMLLGLRSRLVELADLPLIERMLRESKTWALVDDLAGHTVGMLRDRDVGIDMDLDRWARDGDFWIRRSAMLAHLRALRRGEGDFEVFARYAEAMLEEREFFIRKAIGWILRDTSKKRPDLVVEWIAPRTGRASGVTMWEVVRHLPEAEAARLMDAYRAGRAASEPASR